MMHSRNLGLKAGKTMTYNEAILELVKGKRVRISEDNGEVSLHLLKDESSVSADRGAENE